MPFHNPLRDPTPLSGGGLSEPQYRYRGGLNAPIILTVITGQAQERFKAQGAWRKEKQSM
jgi:hypothetical protein